MAAARKSRRTDKEHMNKNKQGWGRRRGRTHTPSCDARPEVPCTPWPPCCPPQLLMSALHHSSLLFMFSLLFLATAASSFCSPECSNPGPLLSRIFLPVLDLCPPDIPVRVRFFPGRSCPVSMLFPRLPLHPFGCSVASDAPIRGSGFAPTPPFRPGCSIHWRPCSCSGCLCRFSPPPPPPPSAVPDAPFQRCFFPGHSCRDHPVVPVLGGPRAAWPPPDPVLRVLSPSFLALIVHVLLAVSCRRCFLLLLQSRTLRSWAASSPDVPVQGLRHQDVPVRVHFFPRCSSQVSMCFSASPSSPSPP